MIINSHGHLLPEPQQIPVFMREQKLFWIDDDKQYMRQGDWKRPVTHPSFFLDNRLAWQEENKIDHEVIITLSQLYGNGLSKDLANDIARFQNNFHAETQSNYPNKFTCGFVLPLAYRDLAEKEIDRCVNSLNLKIACLPTHVLIDGQWYSVANLDQFSWLWELLDQYGLAVEIHPYDGPKMIALQDQSWRFHLVWMCAQTADTYHLFTLNGLVHLFPNIRTCFAHGNQYALVNIGRRTIGYEGRPDLFEGKKHPKESIGASNIYFDTLVHDPVVLDLLIKRHGKSQILFGLDNPYPLGEMASDAGNYPGKVLIESEKAGYISTTDKAAICNQNVLNWLGKATI